MKYLLLFAILGFVWWSFAKRNAGGDDKSSSNDEERSEKMLTCAHCGVHLPESEAVLADNRVYCCDAHRVAAQASHRQ